MRGRKFLPLGKKALTLRLEYCSIWCVPNAVGVFNGEGPPVPIPNTEVKLTSADNTCLETDREDRSMPTQKNRCNRSGSFFSTAVEAMRLEMVRIHILRLLGSLAAGAIRLNAPTNTFFASARL